MVWGRVMHQSYIVIDSMIHIALPTVIAAEAAIHKIALLLEVTLAWILTFARMTGILYV